jgi:F0F1-type ATP synthase membrane subunit a
MSSAFVSLVPNAPASGRTIPVCYVPTSVLSLLAIAMLPRTHEKSPTEFSAWLKVLHVLLAAPKILSNLWPKQPTVDSCGLYLFLFLAIAFGGLAGVPPNAWAWPVADCQFSITMDLVLCAGVTLYGIFQRSLSLFAVSAAALLIPIVSPGGVLALYILIDHVARAREKVVTWLQRQVANSLLEGNQKSTWLTLACGTR